MSSSLSQNAEDGLGLAVIELSAGESSVPSEPTLHSLGLPQPSFYAVVLDFSPVSFVDTVSIKILKNVRGWGASRTAASQRVSLGPCEVPQWLLPIPLPG